MKSKLPEKILEFFARNSSIRVTATELSGFLGEKYTTHIRLALADLIHQNRIHGSWEISSTGHAQRKYHFGGADLPQAVSPSSA